MSSSQARTDIKPKQYPFSNRPKTMFPVPKYNLAYHVDVLGKYSKKLPKREVTALDRKSRSGMHWNDTRKFMA